MAINILQLPGMGGATGQLVVNVVQTLENLAACVGLGSLASCFDAIINLALDIFDIWQTFFPSRPKVGIDSASDSTALFFIASSNPIIRLWGIGIRNLESLGIPTSTSGGPGLTALENLATAVKTDLIKQFDGSQAPVYHYLGVQMDGTLIFDTYYQLGFTLHDPASSGQDIADRTLLDNFYNESINLGYIDPQTGFPVVTKPPPPPPPPPHTCPSGYQWDAATGKCVKTVQPPPPPPPPPKPTAGPCPPYTQLPACLPAAPGPDVNGDELTNGLASLAYWNEIVAIYLMNLFEKPSAGGGSGGGSSNPDPVTCQQLNQAVNNLITAIQAVKFIIPNILGIDWTALIAVIQGTPPGIEPNFQPPPPFTRPPPYTIEMAIRDMEAAIPQIPQVVLSPQ